MFCVFSALSTTEVENQLKPRAWTKLLLALVLKTGEEMEIKFSIHKKSAGHKVAVTTAVYERKSVSTQLSSAVIAQQAESRESLLKIIGGVMFLARQGVTFRGHEHRQGNLDQLLKYKAEGDAAFTRRLSGKRGVHTSWDWQNEMLDLMSSSIVREIAEEI